MLVSFEIKRNPNDIFVIKNDMKKTVMSNLGVLTPLKSSDLQKTDVLFFISTYESDARGHEMS